MGHLIQIIKHITNCISESEHIATLIASSFVDESDLQYWHSLIDAEEGEFTKTVTQQSKLLANWNPHEDNEFNKGENFIWDIGANPLQDIVFTMENTIRFRNNIDDDDDDEDEQGGSGGDGHGIGMFTKNSITLDNLSADEAWDMQFQEATMDYVNTLGTVNWDTDFQDANFADFDAHFSSHSSDLGMPQTQPPHAAGGAGSQPPSTTEPTDLSAQQTINNYDDGQRGQHNDEDVSMTTVTINDDQQAEYDNNANVEKASSDKLTELNNEIETGTAKTTTTTTGAATSIVSRLQSVLLDGEEDYEDDEGMWTKPLGGSAMEQPTTPISNGPSKDAEL